MMSNGVSSAAEAAALRAIVVGLGTQGYKRMRVARSMVVASVDPANDEADYKELDAVPLADFDAAFI